METVVIHTSGCYTEYIKRIHKGRKQENKDIWINH